MWLMKIVSNILKELRFLCSMCKENKVLERERERERKRERKRGVIIVFRGTCIYGE